VRPRDTQQGKALESGLVKYAANVKPLPGIEEAPARKALVEQLVESLRRTRFLAVLSTRPIAPERADPKSDLFDPLRAAVLHQKSGNYEEAFWLIFLAVHFGKTRRHGWALARAFYGRFGQGPTWNWQRASHDPAGVRKWIEKNSKQLTGAGSFGNHRKYETFKAGSNGTGAVVESYIKWVTSTGGHSALFAKANAETENDPCRAFDVVYERMAAVRRFGRTARFDYLTYVSGLKLVNIEPGKLYLQGATGPLRGAHLLFGGSVESSIPPITLDSQTASLASHLEVGMNVLEDALCNWQKSPHTFMPFRG